MSELPIVQPNKDQTPLTDRVAVEAHLDKMDALQKELQKRRALQAVATGLIVDPGSTPDQLIRQLGPAALAAVEHIIGLTVELQQSGSIEPDTAQALRTLGSGLIELGGTVMQAGEQ